MSITLGILAGLSVMLMWGVMDFLLAIPLKKIGTFKVLFVINSLSIVFTLILLAWFLPTGKIHISWAEAGILVVLAGVNLVAHYNFYKAFELGEVSIVSPIISAYPPIAVFLAVVFLGERLSGFRILVIMMIVAGVVLSSTDLRKLRHIHTVKGIKEALLSAVMYGFLFFGMGILHKSMGFLNLLVFSNLFLDTAVVTLAISNGGWPALREKKYKSMLPIMLVSSVLGIAAWLLYNYGITTEMVSIVTTLGSIGSVVTVILAMAFFKDKLITNQKIGIALTLLGLVLISL